MCLNLYLIAGRCEEFRIVRRYLPALVHWPGEFIPSCVLYLFGESGVGFLVSFGILPVVRLGVEIHDGNKCFRRTHRHSRTVRNRRRR